MTKQTLLVALIMLVIGAGGGYWFGGGLPKSSAPVSDGTDRKLLFYRHPMNPSVTSPVPAKDAMGMDYVPVYADAAESSAPAGTVKIDPVTVQNIGVRTALAKTVSLSHVIRAVGRVDFDEERLARLHPKTEGWIEKLRIDKTVQWVQKGTDLLSIYSPQLVASQQEYLLALNNLKALESSPFEDIRHGAPNIWSRADGSD